MIPITHATLDHAIIAADHTYRRARGRNRGPCAAILQELHEERCRREQVHEVRASRKRTTDPLAIAPADRWVARLQALASLRMQALRALAGIARRDNLSAIVIERGDRAPRETGRGYVKYHWHNCGASGTVYHPSTRHIRVGADWIIANLAPLRAIQMILRRHGLPPAGTRTGLCTVWRGADQAAAWVDPVRRTAGIGWVVRGRHIAAADRAAAAVEAERLARQAIALRRERRMAADLTTIWVLEADSAAGGNCPAGTAAWIGEFCRDKGWGAIGAMRADYLLSQRDDSFARRAVAAAIRRAAA